jgi:hypothetical protein
MEGTVKQNVKMNSSSTEFVVYSRSNPLTLKVKKVRKTQANTDIRIWIQELEKAFCEFSKQAARLARLAQQQKKSSIPSDAFNRLLSESVREVELAYDAYIRRKDELLTNIKTFSQRSRFYGRGKSRQPPSSIAEIKLI